MLSRDGIPTREDLAAVMPPEARLRLGPVAMAECFQRIPCNPCASACVRKAIRVEPGINDLPRVDFDRCTGCGACIAACPGLAIFVVDLTYGKDEALVKLPFEFLPVPQKGQLVRGLDRAGAELGWFPVVQVNRGSRENKTVTITLAVPKDLAMAVRNIRAGGYRDGRE